MSQPCWVVDLGAREYPAAFALQQRVVEARRQGCVPDLLLLVEHPPVVTLGRSADERNLLASAEALAVRGIDVHESNRGGDVTYHGPGQLVGYPHLRLTGSRRDIHAYVRSLESLLIRALSEFGIVGGRVPDLTGVWVGEEPGDEEKIAAIGVAIRHWVTMHGFALNVDPNLDHFRLIRPCGIAGRGVTSMRKLLGGAPVKVVVRDAVVEAFCGEFELDPQWVAPEELVTRLDAHDPGTAPDCF